MHIEKCGCGKDARYFVADSGKSSCNKIFRCPTYDELVEINKQRTLLIMFGLDLIRLAEHFTIDIGKGWLNFKQRAKDLGLEIK